jgi:hypothetical protein
MVVIARRFSLVNFAIATSALCFQVFVLYPWHEQLDEDFKTLRKEQLDLMRESQKAHASELKVIKELLESYKKR